MSSKFKNVGGGEHNLAQVGFLRVDDVFETNEVIAASLRANAPDIYVEQSAEVVVTMGINDPEKNSDPVVTPVVTEPTIVPLESSITIDATAIMNAAVQAQG